MVHRVRAKGIHAGAVVAPPFFELLYGILIAPAVPRRARGTRGKLEPTVLTRASKRKPRGRVVHPLALVLPWAVAV